MNNNVPFDYKMKNNSKNREVEKQIEQYDT